MLLNVFDSVNKRAIEIDSSKLDPAVHFHVNARVPFSQNDLDSFGYSPVVEAPVEAPVETVVVEEPVVDPVVEPVEAPVDLESMTKAQLVEYALAKGIELDPTILKADMIATLTA